MQEKAICGHSVDYSSSDDSFCLQIKMQQNQASLKKFLAPTHLIINLDYRLQSHCSSMHINQPDWQPWHWPTYLPPHEYALAHPPKVTVLAHTASAWHMVTNQSRVELWWEISSSFLLLEMYISRRPYHQYIHSIHSVQLVQFTT